jgi:hypothetical protein
MSAPTPQETYELAALADMFAVVVNDSKTWA